MNIALIDDHRIVRQGLRALLEKESDMIIVAEAEDGRQAVQAVKNTRPDIVIMDIAFPIMNGIEATRRIKSEFPERGHGFTKFGEQWFVPDESDSVGA